MILKRIIVIVVAAVMLISLFAGCGGNSSTSGTKDTQAAPEPVKPVVLTMWRTANQQSDFALGQEERFKQKYPGITLNKVLINEGSGTEYMTAFAAGTNPDFGGTGQPQMAAYCYAGIAMPLDDYFSGWPDYTNIKQEIVENFNVAGKHYALPINSYTMVLCYNKKLFADAGIANPPATWDEWLETAQRLTDPAKQQWGMNMLVSYWTEWWFEYFVWMAGGDLTKQNPDGTLALTFTDPAVAKAIELYRKFIAAKCIQPDLTLDYGNLQKQFSTGHAAMTLYGSDGLHNFVNDGMKVEDVGYAELPVGPGGKAVSQMGGGCDFIFSNISKEKADAAWAWLSFANSKEELEATLKDQASKGGADPQVVLRKDVDISLGKIDPVLQAVVDKCVLESRLEFYGKGIVGSYVDKAVQKTTFDPKADIVKEFKAQQDLAQKEVADKFNADVLASKKK